MPKALVVYYSRTGYTRSVAERIAAACGADIEAIEEFRDRSGFFGYWRSGFEAMKKRAAEIRPPAFKPSDYDIVILGTPVWASNLCSPMRAYVEAYKSQLGRVAFFCTEGGRGGEKVMDDLASLCERRPIATLVVKDREIDQERYAAEAERFARAVMLPRAA